MTSWLEIHPITTKRTRFGGNDLSTDLAILIRDKEAFSLHIHPLFTTLASLSSASRSTSISDASFVLSFHLRRQILVYPCISPRTLNHLTLSKFASFKSWSTEHTSLDRALGKWCICRILPSISYSGCFRRQAPRTGTTLFTWCD